MDGGERDNRLDSCFYGRDGNSKYGVGPGQELLAAPAGGFQYSVLALGRGAGAETVATVSALAGGGWQR